MFIDVHESDAVLVGTALLKAEDITARLKELTGINDRQASFPPPLQPYIRIIPTKFFPKPDLLEGFSNSYN